MDRDSAREWTIREVDGNTLRARGADGAVARFPRGIFPDDLQPGDRFTLAVRVQRDRDAFAHPAFAEAARTLADLKATAS